MRLVRYRGKWAVTGKDEASGKVWRTSLRTSDRATAERRFKDFRIETPGETVGDAMAAYLKEKKAQKVRSYASMETSWRALSRTFGHLRPDQIDRVVCRRYADSRRPSGGRGGVSDGTIIKDIGVLKASLGFVLGKTYGGATFEFPHAPPPRERYITKAELQSLLDAAALPHIRLFILLAWSTAARASALFELTWAQIDFDRRQIRLAKGAGRRKGRATVYMTDRARDALKAAYEARTCEYVIEWGGKPVKSVNTAFAEACRKAGLKDVSPHVLRHSAAVAMVEDGAPILEVAQVLGHTNPSVTFRVYGRFSPGFLAKTMKALE